MQRRKLKIIIESFLINAISKTSRDQVDLAFGRQRCLSQHLSNSPRKRSLEAIVIDQIHVVLIDRVRTMPRASHRGTCKRGGKRVNEVNEDSKLKCEVYRGAKAIPLTATRSATPMIYNARRGTPPMTKHTSIYLDSASRRQRGLLSTRTPSGQAATKFGLAVDQRGWPTLWRLKGYVQKEGER